MSSHEKRGPPNSQISPKLLNLTFSSLKLVYFSVFLGSLTQKMSTLSQTPPEERYRTAENKDGHLSPRSAPQIFFSLKTLILRRNFTLTYLIRANVQRIDRN